MRERMRRTEKRVVDRRMYGEGMAAAEAAEKAAAAGGWCCIVGSDSLFLKAVNFRTLLL